MAEEVRTLIDNSLMYGVLSTNSDAYPGTYAYFNDDSININNISRCGILMN